MDIHIRRALIKDASGIQKINAEVLGAKFPVGKNKTTSYRIYGK